MFTRTTALIAAVAATAAIAAPAVQAEPRPLPVPTLPKCLPLLGAVWCVDPD